LAAGGGRGPGPLPSLRAARRRAARAPRHAAEAGRRAACRGPALRDCAHAPRGPGSPGIGPGAALGSPARSMGDARMTATEPAVPAPAPSVVRSALPGAGYALGVLTFINVINYLDRYLVAGILPRIEDTLHIDHAQGGLLQSIFIVVYMLVAPLGGYVGDRYPRRWVLSLSILIWSFAAGGSGLAMTFALLLAARAIVGVGEAGYGTVSPGLIADFFPISERTRALSVFYVAIPVGSALGFALGGWIGNTWSWHAAFFVGGIPGILAAILALRMQEPARGATEEGGASSQTKMPFMEGLRGLRSNAFHWVSVAGLTLMTFSIGGLAVFMPTFLEKERGVPGAQAAIVFGALLCVSGLVGTLVGGVLGDRAERKS